MKETFLMFLDKLVDVWHTFLDSLATIGGNIFVLLVLWLVSLAGVFHVLKLAAVADDARSLLLSTFSGVTGALMYALTQGGRRNGNGLRAGDYPPPPAPTLPDPPKDTPEVK